MQLSINGWHPVASHLVCIITGIALSNFLVQKSRTYPPIKGQMTFMLSAKIFPDSVKTESGKFPVNIYEVVESEPTCRLFKSGLSIFTVSENYRFSTNLTEQSGVQLLTNQLKQAKKLKIDRHNEKISICKIRPRVTYGT